MVATQQKTCCGWLFIGPRLQRDLWTAALMGFTAGYTTSNTKVRFNTFGGMMTGWVPPTVLLHARLAQCSSMRALPSAQTRWSLLAGSNTVKLGISMAQGQWEWTGIYFACISLFALGTVFALFMIQKLKGRAQNAFLLVFCAMFVLVDGLALAVDRDGDGEYNIYASLISSLASFALGAENLLSQKAGLIKANTTFMTGVRAASF